uniref:Uncharacterized protein n=1 Tax=Setaria italica TaxID=4555 RepID=K3YXJ8_SETIT
MHASFKGSNFGLSSDVLRSSSCLMVFIRVLDINRNSASNSKTFCKIFFLRKIQLRPQLY